MKIKTVVDEDFVNYKLPSMFIGTSSCAGKCCIEAGIPLSVCQNDGWRKCHPVQVDNSDLIQRYKSNSITKAIVIGGLEPFEQYDELLELVQSFRNSGVQDPIVIYTGYYKYEIDAQIKELSAIPNIIVKFGRYIPNRPSRFDNTLGLELVSDNQFAEEISVGGDNDIG